MTDWTPPRRWPTKLAEPFIPRMGRRLPMQHTDQGPGAHKAVYGCCRPIIRRRAGAWNRMARGAALADAWPDDGGEIRAEGSSGALFQRAG